MTTVAYEWATLGRVDEFLGLPRGRAIVRDEEFTLDARPKIVVFGDCFVWA
jgi:hypothetical protein